MLAGGTSRLTSLTATSPPKRTVTLRASSAGVSAPAGAADAVASTVLTTA